jgi:hypothetical protein
MRHLLVFVPLYRVEENSCESNGIVHRGNKVSGARAPRFAAVLHADYFFRGFLSCRMKSRHSDMTLFVWAMRLRSIDETTLISADCATFAHLSLLHFLLQIMPVCAYASNVDEFTLCVRSR